MGGGQERSNTVSVAGKNDDLTDGSGGLALDCPPSGRLAARIVTPHAVLGKAGILGVTPDGVELIVAGAPVAVSRGSATRLVKCLDAGFTYRGQLEETDGRVVIRYRRA